MKRNKILLTLASAAWLLSLGLTGCASGGSGTVSSKGNSSSLPSQESVSSEKPATSVEDSDSPSSVEESSSTHEHDYGEGVVTTPATCTEKGVKTYTCECGDSYTEDIPALGHDPQAVEAVPATHEATGVTAGEKCSRCGETISGCETIEKLVRITFDADGGEYDDYIDIDYSGTLADIRAKAGDPTKEGYSFLGWRLVSGESLLPVYEDTEFKEDATLKAVWESLTELTDSVLQHYPDRDSGTTIPQMWSLVKESEAAKAAGWLKFSFTVSQDFEAIHFLEADGWGSATSSNVKNCTTIWSSGYSGVDLASWDGGSPLISTSGAGVDTLRITDEAGNPLGKLGESGIDFKVGETYNVYYNLDSSKILMIWLSSWSQTGTIYPNATDNTTRDHGHGYEVYYWKASQYYLKVADYVSFGNVYAVN